MNFKDQLAKDTSIFINVNEFADIHNLDGEDIPIIIESDLSEILSQRKDERYDGVYRSEIIIFVESSYIPDPPVYGQRMTLDDEIFTVLKCRNDNGVLKIFLEANDS